MEQKVVIKSNRYGINLILKDDVPFEELLDAVISKFHESDKFFKNANIAVSFSGRELSVEEELRIVDAITQHTSVKIICIIDEDETREQNTRSRIEETLRKREEGAGQFYKGTLHSGQVLECDTSVVIVGDVHFGAKVVAKGNIVVLGSLNGYAYAGAAGNEDSFVAALHMNPTQIKIADYIGKMEEKKPRERFRGRKKQSEPQIAYIKEEAIHMEGMRNGVFENFY